jgi:hypothetical protein
MKLGVEGQNRAQRQGNFTDMSKRVTKGDNVSENSGKICAKFSWSIHNCGLTLHIKMVWWTLMQTFVGM